MRVGRRAIISIATLLFLEGILCAPAQSAKPQNQDAVKQADAAFHAGYAARQAGQLEAARAHFAEVVRLQPKIPEGHEALAVVLLELGRPKEAIPELLAADRLKPSDPAVQTNLALAYAGAGDASSA